MQKNFVCFKSAGTFFDEESTIEIDTWNINKAIEMSRSVKERYGATPFGFYFYTRAREDNELDSKVINKSNMYYLGGKIETLEDVKSRNDPDDRILISNMQNNNISRIIINSNSWKVTKPLEETDVVLNY
jgi:hypothetical protein